MSHAAKAQRAGFRRWPAPFDAGAYAMALALAYAVKHHCATAGADQLTFLLGPTAALVELATGHEFVAERGTGYFCRALHVVIAPVCSGANFLIVAFTTLVLGFSARAARPCHKLGWFFASAGVAYVATLLINALRITLSLGLAAPPGESPLSAEAAHRLAGIGTYLGGLLTLYALAGRLFARRTLSAVDFAVPLGVYSAVTLVTPWLRGAGARPEYWAHASMVATVLAGTTLILMLWRLRSLSRSGHGDRSSGGRLLCGGPDQPVE